MGRRLLSRTLPLGDWQTIWLVSVLLWTRAAGSLAGDWTAILRLAAEA